VDAVALHVSNAKTDCWEYVVIVKLKVELQLVGSVGCSREEPKAVHGSHVRFSVALLRYK
jgi:hypothetical protein